MSLGITVIFLVGFQQLSQLIHLAEMVDLQTTNPVLMVLVFVLAINPIYPNHMLDNLRVDIVRRGL